jgi:hypothetical protein
MRFVKDITRLLACQHQICVYNFQCALCNAYFTCFKVWRPRHIRIDRGETETLWDATEVEDTSGWKIFTDKTMGGMGDQTIPRRFVVVKLKPRLQALQPAVLLSKVGRLFLKETWLPN